MAHSLAAKSVARCDTFSHQKGAAVPEINNEEQPYSWAYPTDAALCNEDDTTGVTEWEQVEDSEDDLADDEIFVDGGSVDTVITGVAVDNVSFSEVSFFEGSSLLPDEYAAFPRVPVVRKIRVRPRIIIRHPRIRLRRLHSVHPL